MTMLNLSTQTLHKVGEGLLEKVLDKAINEAQLDIAERPKITAPRKIVVELILKPADSGEDNIQAVDVQFCVDLKKPKSTFKRRLSSLPRSNTLGFHTDTNSIRPARGQGTFESSSPSAEVVDRGEERPESAATPDDY